MNPNGVSAIARLAMAICVLMPDHPLAILHRFSANGLEGRNPSGPLIESGGTLYGMTERGGTMQGGALYRIDTNGSNFAVIHHFASPSRPIGSPVRGRDGAFYGLTLEGGSYSGGGTIFRLTTNGTYSVLHEFGWDGIQRDTVRGGEPCPGLLQDEEEALYGATATGGGSRKGTLFRFDYGTANLTRTP